MHPSSRALLYISSRSSHHSFSHPSSCVSKTVSMTLEKNSQDESFNLNWAPRNKSKHIVLPGPGNAVHICVVWNIICCPILCFCSKLMSSVLYCGFHACRGRERGDAPQGLWPGPWLGLWYFWMDDFVFPTDHRAMVDQQSSREFRLQ